MAQHRVVRWWHVVAVAAPFLVAVLFSESDSLVRGSNRLASLLRLSPNTEQAAFDTSRGTSLCSPAELCLDHRQQEEHQKLLQRMRRPNLGKLKPNSPRHRLLTALHAFYRYSRTTGEELQKIRDMFEQNIKKDKRDFINTAVNYGSKINQTRQLIHENDKVAQEIVDCALEFYGMSFSELAEFASEVEASGKAPERVSVSQALKHYVRDWAVDGEHERGPTFPILLETLGNHFPERPHVKADGISTAGDDLVQVLVPGSGVGRLAHDIHGLGGFEVTANEWSMYMNLAYRYVTSRQRASSTAIYPFIDWWSHQATTEELHRQVVFPDVPVGPSGVLLVEGDFTTALNEPSDTGNYDAVVTLFFIDTARNLLSYLETIHRVLKPGGLWINLGPLLYGSAPFLQLSLDEIIDLAKAVGFDFLETDPRHGNLSLPDGKGWVRQMEAPYGFHRQALWKNAYWAQHWIARRR